MTRPLRCFNQEANSLSHQHQRKPWTSRSSHQQTCSLKDSDEIMNKLGYMLQQNKPIRERKPRCSGNSYLLANAYGYSYNHQAAKQGLETPTRSKQQNQVLTMGWNSKGATLPAVPHSSTIQTFWVQPVPCCRPSMWLTRSWWKEASLPCKTNKKYFMERTKARNNGYFSES